MAQAGIQLNRSADGIVLPQSVSATIWDRVVQSESLVFRLGSQIDVPAGGSITPTLVTMPEPAWVDETDEKKVGRPTMSSVSMKPYKCALIVPFSNEFKRDIPGLYNAIARKLPDSIAKFVDKSVFFGPSPGTGFATLSGAPTQAIGSTTTYADYMAALSKVVLSGAGDADISDWVLSTQAELLAMGVLAADGRPLFTAGATSGGSVGYILGRPVYKSKVAYMNPTETGTDVTADTIGFAGDWKTLSYGFVEAITVRYSDQATINDGGTQINLWQRNMFALLVECELGVSVVDVNGFVRLTGQVTQ